MRRAGRRFSDGGILVFMEVFVRAFGYQKRYGRLDVRNGDRFAIGGLFDRILRRVMGIARARLSA